MIGNDFEMLSNVKIQLATQFQMKDLGEAQYVLGIKIIRDRKNKIIALSQENYINSILTKYNMQDSKKGLHLLDMESIFLRTSFLRQPKRKNTCHMLQQLVVLCM